MIFTIYNTQFNQTNITNNFKFPMKMLNDFNKPFILVFVMFLL